MKTFASQIYAAVHSGRLTQPFNAAMVRKACPGWAERTYIRVSSESGSVFDTECQQGRKGGTTYRATLVINNLLTHKRYSSGSTG